MQPEAKLLEGGLLRITIRKFFTNHEVVFSIKVGFESLVATVHDVKFAGRESRLLKDIRGLEKALEIRRLCTVQNNCHVHLRFTGPRVKRRITSCHFPSDSSRRADTWFLRAVTTRSL